MRIVLPVFDAGIDMTPTAADAECDEVAYIARLCRELRDLANQSQFGFLAYLLDMARLEAEAQMGTRPGAPEDDNRNKAQKSVKAPGCRGSERL